VNSEVFQHSTHNRTKTGFPVDLTQLRHCISN